MRFENKVVVVTGAGQGLGEGFIKGFCEEGAIGILIGRTLSKIERVRDEIITSGGRAHAYLCDVGVAEDVERCFEEIMEEHGKVDVLVNNAAYHKSVPITELDVDEWKSQIDINLNGIFYATKAVLPKMIEEKYGKILNISSSAARLFFPGFSAYAASKGGMISFTNTVSEEVKEHDININSIYLGMTNTEHTRNRFETDGAITIDLDEMLQVEDVTPVVLFLTSDEASPIMGSAIEVYGKKA